MVSQRLTPGRRVGARAGRVDSASGTWVETTIEADGRALWGLAAEGSFVPSLAIDVEKEAAALVGGRVWVTWPGRAFSGTVSAYDGTRLSIAYDDGDRGQYTPAELLERGVGVSTAPLWALPPAAGAGDAPDEGALLALRGLLDDAFAVSSAVIEPSGELVLASWPCLPGCSHALRLARGSGGAAAAAAPPPPLPAAGGAVLRSIEDAADTCFRALASAPSPAAPEMLPLLSACAALVCDGGGPAAWVARHAVRLGPVIFGRGGALASESAPTRAAAMRLLSGALACGGGGRGLEVLALAASGAGGGDAAGAMDVLWGRIETSAKLLSGVTSVPPAALLSEAHAMMDVGAATALLPALAEVLAHGDDHGAAAWLNVVMETFQATAARSSSSSSTAAAAPAAMAGAGGIAVGTIVRARFHGSGSYYRGRISKVNNAGGPTFSVDIAYDDGDAETSVAPAFVKVVDANGTERDLTAAAVAEAGPKKDGSGSKSPLPAIVVYYVTSMVLNLASLAGEALPVVDAHGREAAAAAAAQFPVLGNANALLIGRFPSWRKFSSGMYVLRVLAGCQVRLQGTTDVSGVDALTLGAAVCRAEVRCAEAAGLTTAVDPIKMWFRTRLCAIAEQIVDVSGTAWAASLRACTSAADVPAGMRTCAEFCGPSGLARLRAMWHGVVAGAARYCVHGSAVEITCIPPRAPDAAFVAAVERVLAGTAAAGRGCVRITADAAVVECTDALACVDVIDAITGASGGDDTHVLAGRQPLLASVGTVAMSLYHALARYRAFAGVVFPQNGGLAEPVVFAAFAEVYRGLHQVSEASTCLGRAYHVCAVVVSPYVFLASCVVHPHLLMRARGWL